MAMALEATASGTASEVSVATSVANLDEDEPMVTILPQDVIEMLAELDLELSEGKQNVEKTFFSIILGVLVISENLPVSRSEHILGFCSKIILKK